MRPNVQPEAPNILDSCLRYRAACCAVVTTAEYCTEVIGALARNVAKLLDPPLGDEVSSGSEV